MLNAWPAIWCLKSTELIATAVTATNDSSVNRVPSLSTMFNKKIRGCAQVSGTFATDGGRYFVVYSALSNKLSPL